MKESAEGEYVEFVTHHADALCRTAYLLCGDWRRAEDATQEALIKLYRRWPKLRDTRLLAGYARKVVVSTTLDGLRKRSSRELGGDQVPELALADPAVQVENRLLVVAALATLPPRQRACVVLRYFDQLSVDETADLLRCSTGTVKSQTSRGLATLRQHLAASGITDLVALGG